LRLAYFHPKFTEVGGAEILALKHAELLREGGVDVTFVTFAVKGSYWAEPFRQWTVNVVPKRAWRDVLGGWTRLGKLRLRARRAQPILEGFDAVLATNHPCCTMLGELAVPGRKLWYCNEAPRSLFPRETTPYATAALARLGPVTPALEALRKELQAAQSPFGPYRSARKASLAAIPRLHQLLFNSRFSLDNARSAYGDLQGEVLYPVIAFPPVRAPRRGLDRDALRILVQARLTPLKNLETVVEGFKRFHLRHPHAELHILGSGPSKASLQALAAAGPGAGGTTFHGFLAQAEVDQLRERCSVFALLAMDEPFGMVYPEAAAQGLLLVGPDHGGPREILEEGRLGRLCDALTPAAFEEALEAILATGDGELDLLRAEADQACRHRFSAETLGPQLLRAVRRRLEGTTAIPGVAAEQDKVSD
jgi:glycosyltransferase involved in cell wall biosynthesis